MPPEETECGERHTKTIARAIKQESRQFRAEGGSAGLRLAGALAKSVCIRQGKENNLVGEVVSDLRLY